MGQNFVALTAYYNFLRPHTHAHGDVLNKVKGFQNISLMPAKWEVMIYLGQKEILELQKQQAFG